MLSNLVWLIVLLQVVYGRQGGPVLEDQFGNLFIKAVVKTGFKTTKITDVHSGGIEVELKSHNMDGKANDEFLSMMADVLGLIKPDVAIFLGEDIVDKVLIVRNHRITPITAEHRLRDARC